MAHEMIAHDQTLISDHLRITLGAGLPSEQSVRIAFQFPPKIKSDDRSGQWKENSTGPTAGDPIVYYEHGEPRKTILEWYYIVGAGKSWTAEYIWTQLLSLRRYFVNKGSTNLKDGIYASLAVHALLWRHGGKEPFSFRLHSVSVKHGDAMVGVGANAFHLRTDVTAHLHSWPRILDTQFAPGQVVTAADWY